MTEKRGNRVQRFVILAFLSMHVATATTFAQEPAPPAHPRTAPPGWINLFDGETLFGWHSMGDAAWKVVEGVLLCEGGSGGWIATTCRFTDFELVAKVRVKAGTTSGLVVRSKLDGHPIETGGAIITLAEPEKTTPPWREVRVMAHGSGVTASVDGSPVSGVAPSNACGHIGILYHHNNGGKVEVASLQLRPLNLQPIFNGKDLAGWYILPNYKSKFAVVDGALNILDGRGQIETEAVYKDFLLQLDIISNGDQLNSGVFFRGPAKVIWKGYESQIRNQWEGDDRARPVDFGTGGIYGNQPARWVVPDDREWFQKTIVCDGNHMAVWVNGYQVSDFTDTRAVSPDSNGKQGYVPGPGTIHLQGHDPKTNLSFKNIVIQEYPEGDSSGTGRKTGKKR